MNKIINLHIYPSSLTNASRILKEAKSLIKLFLVDEVHLLGYIDNVSPNEEKLDDNVFVHRLNLRTNKSEYKVYRYFTFIEFFFKALAIAPRYKASIINCHSLHVLPIGVLLKIFTKTKLIYDAHELETEVKGAKGILKIFIKILEKVCMPFVDELIVVSDTIGNWYKDKYGLKRYTAIYNIPLAERVVTNSDKFIFRKMFGLNHTDIIFIYQGILSEPRGVDEILTTFKQASSHLHVIFMGDGPYKEVILNATLHYKNVHYYPYVKPSEVLYFTSGADVGIHIIKNTCLNHYFCLPNKIFEYLKAGIPFIVSDFPEMAKIVSSSNGGWLIQPNWQSLLDKIKNISIQDLREKKQNIEIIKSNYAWEIEELKYIPLYNRIKKKIKKPA